MTEFLKELRADKRKRKNSLHQRKILVVQQNLQNRVIQQLKLNGLERSLTKMFKDSENLTEVKDETDNLTAQLEDINK